MENIILYSYIVCGIINYIVFKKHTSDSPNTWGLVRTKIFMLLSGYIGSFLILFVLFVLFIIKFEDKWNNIKFPDPPKWF